MRHVASSDMTCCSAAPARETRVAENAWCSALSRHWRGVAVAKHLKSKRQWQSSSSSQKLKSSLLEIESVFIRGGWRVASRGHSYQARRSFSLALFRLVSRSQNSPRCVCRSLSRLPVLICPPTSLSCATLRKSSINYITSSWYLNLESTQERQHTKKASVSLTMIFVRAGKRVERKSLRISEKKTLRKIKERQQSHLEKSFLAFVSHMRRRRGEKKKNNVASHSNTSAKLWQISRLMVFLSCLHVRFLIHTEPPARVVLSSLAFFFCVFRRLRRETE